MHTFCEVYSTLWFILKILKNKEKNTVIKTNGCKPESCHNQNNQQPL